MANKAEMKDCTLRDDQYTMIDVRGKFQVNITKGYKK
jgi:hypothetical protein